MPERPQPRLPHRNVLTILHYVSVLARSETPKRTIVFFFRSFWHFGLTSRWLTFLEDFGRRHGLGAPPLNLVRKAFGAYFTMSMSLDQRVGLLEQHYMLGSRLLPRPIMEALWQGQSSELGRVAGKKDEYAVWLRRADQCGTRHEGEWTAGFVSLSSGLLLCRITLILTMDQDGMPSIAIGGLQGPARDVPKATLVTATRDLGGLRPKDAMLLVAAGIARSLDRETMNAVGNAAHPINYRGRRRRAKMLTDYDDYWRDRGGLPGGTFGFVLPAKDPSEAEPGNRRRDEAKQAFFRLGYRLLARPEASEEEPLPLPQVQMAGVGP